MNNRTWDLMLKDPEEADVVAREAEEAARAADYPRGLAASLLNRGWIAIYRSKFEEALRFLDDSRQISRELGDAEGIAKTINARGVAFHNQSDYNRALDAYREGLTYAETEGLTGRTISVLNNIGEVYLEIKRFDDAEEYFRRALELLTTGAGSDALEDLLAGRATLELDEAGASVVGNLGSIALTRHDFALAERCFAWSLELAERAENRLIESELKTHLGVLALERGDHALAEKYHTESLRVSQTSKNSLTRTSTMIHLGGLHERLGQPEGALALYERALESALEAGSPYLESRACSRLAELLESSGEWERALEYHKRFARIRLDLLSQSSEQKLRSLTAQLESDRLRVANDRLQVINNFAQEITATLDLEEIFERVYRNINEIIDATVIGIALYDDASGTLDFKLLMEEGEPLDPVQLSVDRTDSFSAWAIRERREVVIEDREAEGGRYLQDSSPQWGGEQSSSLVFLPLIIKDRIVGLLTVQSRRTNAYSDLDLQVIRAVSSFVAIALDNAIIVNRVNLLNQIVRREKDELESVYRQISFLANHDHLTGLANRRMLVEMLDLTISQVAENGDKAGVLFIDLDRFKPINDDLGHEAGDEVLRIVAQRVRSALRHDDLAARMGGDEFVAIVRGVPSREVVRGIADKITAGIAEPIAVSGTTVRVSSSLGIALFPDDGATSDALIRAADNAMYQDKQEQRQLKR